MLLISFLISSKMGRSNIKVKQKYFPDGCQMCGAERRNIELVGELAIYGKKYSEQDKKYWRCKKCKSYVGCHHERNKPYGILSDELTRFYKGQVHALFDPIWQYYIFTKKFKKYEARNKAYEWLGKQMNLNKEYCHIGFFTVEMSKEAIFILEEVYRKSISLRRFKKRIESKEITWGY